MALQICARAHCVWCLLWSTRNAHVNRNYRIIRKQNASSKRKLYEIREKMSFSQPGNNFSISQYHQNLNKDRVSYSEYGFFFSLSLFFKAMMFKTIPREWTELNVTGHLVTKGTITNHSIYFFFPLLIRLLFMISSNICAGLNITKSLINNSPRI